MTEGVAKRSLSLYGCVGSTPVARLLQDRMEEGIMLTSLDAEEMKKINSMWKIRMVSVHTSIVRIPVCVDFATETALNSSIRLQ